MNNIPRTIHDILGAWGRSQHASPPHGETLKGAVLLKFSGFPHESFTLPHRLPWFSFALAGLAVLTLFIAPFRFGGVGVPSFTVPIREESRVVNEGAMDSVGQKIAPEYYPQPTPTVPVTDTREFLKTDYAATVRTRRVEELAQRIQTIVRGFGGRVDTSVSAEKWGSVSFVVPASRFDSFRTEIRSLVYARFLVEGVNTENLLPQKRAIENEQSEFEKALVQLRADREELTRNHLRNVASIKSRLLAIGNELTVLEAEVTVDPTRQAEIAARKQELLNERANYNTRLRDALARYGRELNALDAQIRNAELNLERLGKQDRELLDTVATVRGTISLRWITLWEIVGLYLPAYWLSVLLALGAIGAYIWHRHRSRFIVL